MMTSDEIAAIRARADTFSGLQYVVAESIIQLPWTSSEATNQIVDLVRAIPDLLNALAAQTARAEAAERDWNDAIGYWHACAKALGASQARERALAEALEEVACIDNNERLDAGEQVQFAMRIAEAALTQVAAMKHCAALASAGEDAR